mmetsp:Transcript_14043/g.41125  ORF Transcript_14043/g.41125 Transcript_14043/m.41125 type:complete len:201 (-) Transcript_14043:258-860(-)
MALLCRDRPSLAQAGLLDAEEGYLLSTAGIINHPVNSVEAVHESLTNAAIQLVFGDTTLLALFLGFIFYLFATTDVVTFSNSCLANIHIRSSPPLRLGENVYQVQLAKTGHLGATMPVKDGEYAGPVRNDCRNCSSRRGMISSSASFVIWPTLALFHSTSLFFVFVALVGFFFFPAPISLVRWVNIISALSGLCSYESAR